MDNWNPDTPTSERLISVEMLHLNADVEAATHLHPFSELVYVVKGQYHVHCDGQDLTGSSGDFFYYPAGCQHRPSYSGSGPTQLYVAQWYEGPDIDDSRPRKVHDNSGRLLVAMEWLWELFPPQTDEDHEAANALLTALLHNHRRVLHETSDDLLRRLHHKFLQNLSHPFTLETMAMVAGYSKFHFVRLFRRISGTTPMKYLQQLRVQRAIHLLQHTDLPLKAIATQVGFGNVDYLSRLIRKETGRTPTGLRRGHPNPNITRVLAQTVAPSNIG